MRGYSVEYKISDEETGAAFVPEGLYIPFLQCMKDHKVEITAATLTEAATTEITTESFGWVVETGNGYVFVPDTHLEAVMHRLKKPDQSARLTDWTNRIVFGLEYPVLNE